MAFSTYEEARAWAQKQANEAADANPEHASIGGCDYGVEHLPAYHGGTVWRAWRLPLPRNRFGYEMRCEVVQPEIGRFT